MKTIALREKTYELLEELKEKEKTASFNELILKMIHKAKETPASLFGALKGKTKKFTTRERHKIWGEEA
ncbi:MAG: antitoxin VapB family protein [Nanoarchaeota archaeon]